ncbi:MAG TPA: hypothetical protein VFP60_00275 [Pseudolabrys sp.]|nr:hypothetical protein [Pseudolabrys sp.]
MTRDRMIRLAAVLVGAGVLLAMDQGLGLKLYIAIPAGIVAYVITLVALALALGTGQQRK